MAKYDELEDSRKAAVREWYSSIGTGWRVWDKDKRSLVSRINAQKRWALRRARYGETGQKPVGSRLRKKLEAVGWECKESLKGKAKEKGE